MLREILMKKGIKLIIIAILAMILLTGCNSKEVAANSSGAAMESQSGSAFVGADTKGNEDEASANSSSTTSNEQDQYLTDPVPEGKPSPVEPDSVTVDESKTHTCTFSIECTTILDNLSDLEDGKLDAIPEDCIILPESQVTFSEGESVFDVLQRICKDNKIHMEASWTPIYNSAYIEGISNLYEFDCGNLSGWMYSVNGWYPNYGCSRYSLQDGDKVEWRYTCDLGYDVGGGYAAGE